jgi:hypothetical protein
MDGLKLQEWFYGLPIWDEIDNYVYFGLAGLLLWLVPFGDEAIKTIGAGLVGALILKGRGPQK